MIPSNYRGIMNHLLKVHASNSAQVNSSRDWRSQSCKGREPAKTVCAKEIQPSDASISLERGAGALACSSITSKNETLPVGDDVVADQVMEAAVE